MPNYKPSAALPAGIAASALQSQGQRLPGDLSFPGAFLPFLPLLPSTFSSTHHKIILCVVPIHSPSSREYGFPHGGSGKLQQSFAVFKHSLFPF